MPYMVREFINSNPGGPIDPDDVTQWTFLTERDATDFYNGLIETWAMSSRVHGIELTYWHESPEYPGEYVLAFRNVLSPNDHA